MLEKGGTGIAIQRAREEGSESGTKRTKEDIETEK